ncbi:hypothetical protein ACE198_21365 [Neobacillus sp. KR4-4]|uniref:hypothetical protein n=1 Tax=Neobacillus sp. KR4-4 TaxID=3344872 RepID=UPI0035CA2622
MKIEVYYDKKNEWYNSLFNYTNPEKGNKVEGSYVVREKNGELKIDIEKSRDVDPEEIRKSFKREACIHCK